MLEENLPNLIYEITNHPVFWYHLGRLNHLPADLQFYTDLQSHDREPDGDDASHDKGGDEAADDAAALPAIAPLGVRFAAAAARQAEDLGQGQGQHRRPRPSERPPRERRHRPQSDRVPRVAEQSPLDRRTLSGR